MFRSRSFELAAIEKLRTGQIPGALAGVADRLQAPAALLKP